MWAPTSLTLRGAAQEDIESLSKRKLPEDTIKSVVSFANETADAYLLQEANYFHTAHCFGKALAGAALAAQRVSNRPWPRRAAHDGRCRLRCEGAPCQACRLHEPRGICPGCLSREAVS